MLFYSILALMLLQIVLSFVIRKKGFHPIWNIGSYHLLKIPTIVASVLATIMFFQNFSLKLFGTYMLVSMLVFILYIPIYIYTMRSLNKLENCKIDFKNPRPMVNSVLALDILQIVFILIIPLLIRFLEFNI